MRVIPICALNRCGFIGTDLYDGLEPRCYIPSFVEIGLPVLEKKIFKGFVPYMGMAAILVM